MSSAGLYLGRPSKPRDQECEFCPEGKPATRAIELKRRKGTYMYVCDRHLKTAEAANTRGSK